ncbi:SRPBCC domain-containing protein [uncultured Roseibium sp.]|uniref:SRPBCC family protein n=1 Tax=uncultured Roseibium sp. TaxID=1936171 RepID=UPI002605F525|nr:SRPBCC domain-containing protein [uncultured Roseibium sp.]
MTKAPIPLVVRRIIEAPRERLFSAFTNSETLTCWFTPSPDISVEALEYEFAPGGRFHLRYEMPDGRKPCVAGVFKEIEPSRLIVMTWEWQAPDPLENVPMVVTFRFLNAGIGTEVVVVHEGIPSDQACTIHAEGWEGTLTILGNFIHREIEQ